MRAEYQYCADRHFLNRLDENRASPPQLIDNVAIVHDLVMDVDRPPVRFECEFHDVNGPYDAGAKSSRPHAYQRLPPPFKPWIFVSVNLPLRERNILT